MAPERKRFRRGPPQHQRQRRWPRKEAISQGTAPSPCEGPRKKPKLQGTVAFPESSQGQSFDRGPPGWRGATPWHHVYYTGDTHQRKHGKSQTTPSVTLCRATSSSSSQPSMREETVPPQEARQLALDAYLHGPIYPPETASAQEQEEFHVQRARGRAEFKRRAREQEARQKRNACARQLAKLRRENAELRRQLAEAAITLECTDST